MADEPVELGMIMDWSKWVGDILIAFGFIGTGVLYAYKIGSFTKSVELLQDDVLGQKDITKTIGDVLISLKEQNENTRGDIIELKTTTKAISEVMTNLAVQKERLDAQGQRQNVMDQRIEDLRNGRGYIEQRSGRGKTIDGEY